jgi:hypothetical protein
MADASRPSHPAEYMETLNLPLEIGKYRGRIRDYGIYQSPVGQQLPTIYVSFDLIGRYEPTTDRLAPCESTTRTYEKAITDRTIGWVIADLRSIGYDRPALNQFDPEAEGAADLFGREIDLDCKHEIYEGSVRERWSIFRELKRKKLATEALNQLDALFGAHLKKAFAEASKDEAAVSEPTDADDTNEETP